MSSRKIPNLSKSRYLSGRQCPLRLWHQCYCSELASEISPFQQAVFDTGQDTLVMVKVREKLLRLL